MTKVGVALAISCDEVGTPNPNMVLIPTKGGGPGALASGLADGQVLVNPQYGSVYVLVTAPDTPANPPSVYDTMDDPDRKWFQIQILT